MPRACNETCIGRQWCPLSKFCKHDYGATVFSYIKETFSKHGAVIHTEKIWTMSLEPYHGLPFQDSGRGTIEIREFSRCSNIVDFLFEIDSGDTIFYEENRTRRHFIKPRQFKGVWKDVLAK
jgi:hypothetical protein